jgi:hypothetical protein
MGKGLNSQVIFQEELAKSIPLHLLNFIQDTFGARNFTLKLAIKCHT